MDKTSQLINDIENHLKIVFWYNNLLTSFTKHQLLVWINSEFKCPCTANDLICETCKQYNSKYAFGCENAHLYFEEIFSNENLVLELKRKIFLVIR